MPSQGPNSPGTVVNDATVGTRPWNSPTGANVSDNIYATQDPIITTTSHYLKCTNFAFNEVVGKVTGIKVEVERLANADLLGDYVVDNSVRLVLGGTIQGNNKADTVTHWPLADSYAVYGGDGDLWGLLPLAAEARDSGFGVALACDTNVSGMNGALVDHIRITVYYEGEEDVVLEETGSAFLLTMLDN